MKRKTLILFLSIVCFFCNFTYAYCEKSSIFLTAGEDWSWESGAHNTFDGELDLTEYIGKSLKINMTADIPYESESEQAGHPVFVIVNGSRITMMKQSETITYTPTEEEPAVHFSAKLTLPEKKRIYEITFQFSLYDDTGTEMNIISAALNVNENGTGNAFYIPADINKIAIIIGTAAAAVWIAAVISALYFRKKERTGE